MKMDRPVDHGMSEARLARIAPFLQERYIGPGKLDPPFFPDGRFGLVGEEDLRERIGGREGHRNGALHSEIIRYEWLTTP